MDTTINAKQLRESLPETVRRVRRGERFTVLYRSRPAFRIVPIQDDAGWARDRPAEEDPLYGSGAVGESTDGLTSRDHDEILYGRK